MAVRKLLGYDGAVLASIGRRILADRADRLTLVLAVPFLVILGFAWLARLPSDDIPLLVAATGFTAAFIAVRSLAARIEFQQTDGVLAAVALEPKHTLRYASSALALGSATAVALLHMASGGHAVEWINSSLVGAIAGLLWIGVSKALRKHAVHLRFWRGLRVLRRSIPLHRLSVLGLCAGLLCAVLPGSPMMVASFAAAITCAASVFLASVDAQEVRFMTMVGKPASSIAAFLLLPLAGWAAPFLLVLGLARDLLPAGVGGAVFLAASSFAVLRILAYRSFDKRLADWTVTGIVTGTAAIALSLTFAAPLVLLTGLVWLVRRAAPRDWLIA